MIFSIFNAVKHHHKSKKLGRKSKSGKKSKHRSKESKYCWNLVELLIKFSCKPHLCMSRAIQTLWWQITCEEAYLEEV